MSAQRESWQDKRSAEQNDLLQPACRDLARCLKWHGYQLSQDEWRWLICASVLGQKIVPGINGGIVALGGSSRKLTKDQCTDAITLAFSIGDAPWEYDPAQTNQVQWGDIVRQARGVAFMDAA